MSNVTGKKSKETDECGESRMKRTMHTIHKMHCYCLETMDMIAVRVEIAVKGFRLESFISEMIFE